MTVLVLAEHDNHSLRPSTLNTVTAAAKCGGEVHLLVVGHNASDAAQQAAKIAGISRVLLADGPQFEGGLAEAVAARALEQYSRWGIPADRANAHVALTPACGLAGADPAWVRLVYAALGIAGRLVRDDEPVEQVES